MGHTRLSAVERRASVIEAARRVFARCGYEGTSTDTIALAAGVSQGYLVRLFGSKQHLFIEVVQASLNLIQASLTEHLASRRASADSSDELERSLGREYIAVMAAHPEALTVLFRLLAAGSDPDLAPVGRSAISSLYRFLRDDALLGAPDAARFLANGVLASTLAITVAGEDPDEDLRELIEETLQENTDAYTRLFIDPPVSIEIGRRPGSGSASV